MLRRQLDMEMAPFRRAGRDENATSGLLRAVRQSLEIPIGEIATKLGVVKSVVLAYEMSELNTTIQMATMVRMAGAMGCKVVYGLVPRDGKTLEALAEERLWQQMLEDRLQRSGVGMRKGREQGIGNREQKSAAQESREEKFRDRGTGDLGTGDEEIEGLVSSSQHSAFSSGGLDRVMDTGNEDFSEAGFEEGSGEMDAAGA